MTELEKIYVEIKQSFDMLWSFKLRGENVLEIITPYSTTSDKFISLFLTKRGGKFIVSDGGLLHSESYESQIDYENQCLLKILYHLEEYYEVKTTQDNKGYKHYYKTTENGKLIPNLVYDMGQFISMCVSSATVQFTDKEEKLEKETFRKQVNSYLNTIIEREKVTINGYLDKKNFRSVRFSAIINQGNSKLSLVNYITGSNSSYFTKSISNASVLFEIADNSIYKEHISSKIAIINNEADGYIPERLFKHIEILKGHTGIDPVIWTEKEKLKHILN